MFESIRTLFCKWTPWEDQLLAALSAQLGEKHRDIFQRQLEAVNKVQRIVGWAEIDLYVTMFELKFLIWTSDSPEETSR